MLQSIIPRSNRTANARTDGDIAPYLAARLASSSGGLGCRRALTIASNRSSAIFGVVKFDEDGDVGDPSF